jgi:hypothetical protein
MPKTYKTRKIRARKSNLRPKNRKKFSSKSKGGTLFKKEIFQKKNYFLTQKLLLHKAAALPPE